MKLTSFFRAVLPLFLMVALLFRCESKEDKGVQLSDSMEYWVEIGNPIAEEYKENWLAEEQRQDFLEMILKKARSRELPTYYYLSDTMIPMDDENLELIFHQTDTEYIENEQGEIEEIAFENELDLISVVRLKFLEQWYFNENTNQFKKEVIAICPMVEVYKNEKEILGYKGLFWIYLNQ